MMHLSASKLLALCIAVALVAQSVHAQSDTAGQPARAAFAPSLGGGLSPEAERLRIQAERAIADERYERAQAACYRKFAVADCQSDARAVRREVLADLRRQEVSLKAAQARLKGAGQLSRIDSKSAPQLELESATQRAVALEKQQARLTGAGEKAATRAAASQDKSPQAGERPARADRKNLTEADIAKKAKAESLNQKKYEEKQKQAQRKAAERRKRQATGPAAPA